VRLAIADPPYPVQRSERYDTATGAPRVTVRSRARRWYGDGPRGQNDTAPADFHPDAGEWDDPARHRSLLLELMDGWDGWAIATTPDGLEAYAPLPVPARILVWHKTRSTPTGHRISSSWEPVILYPPKQRRARTAAAGAGVYGRQIPDVLTAAPLNGGFPGAKPPSWTRWVLDALGYQQDTDTLDDLFPGSGAVTSAAADGVLL
jgi:hypothetical protein